MKSIAVVGGGISGLSAVHALRKKLPSSVHIQLIEASNRLGGLIGTHRHPKYLFETGPRGFRPSKNGAEVVGLVEELSLQDECVESMGHNRFIFTNGRVEQVPSNPMQFFKWSLAPDIVRAVAHELIAPKSIVGDESVYDFVSRRFSKRIAEALLDPMTSGIYAGNIRNLSVRSCFGLLYEKEQQHRSIVKSMFFHSTPPALTMADGTPKSPFVQEKGKAMSLSFKNGMQTLIDGLVSKIETMPNTTIQLNTQLKSITPLASKQVHLNLLADGTSQEIVADHVFSAIPARHLAPAIKDSARIAAAAMAQIEYSSVAIVTLAYKTNILPHKGFGHLVPTCENQKIIGVIYDSCSFPQQQNSDVTRLSVFVGGENHKYAANLSLSEIESIAIASVKDHLGIQVEPDFIASTWYDQAIPQYPVGFHQIVEKIEQDIASSIPSMTLLGNSFYGVGVADSATMSRTIPARALDAVYDPVYTVSNTGGTWRGGYRPHHHIRRSSNDEGQAAVSGTERAKYFKRPILPYVQAVPPEILLSPVSNTHQVVMEQQIDDNLEPTRSVGVQTMYRDSEAQTLPYTPDYTIKVGTSPEIATLANLTFDNGLPAGMAEIELIERNRKKVAFEASLPPMTDEASFQLRKKMMEQQEKSEWAFREVEIDRVHDQRIQLLQKALYERDHEHEFLTEQRIEALRQRLTKEKDAALEEMQQERVTELRMLAKRRAAAQKILPKKDLKRDIIAEYAAFSSTVYAPITRAGKVGRAAINEVGLATVHALSDIANLETAVASKMQIHSMKPPPKVIKTAKDRKQAAIEAHLLSMQTKIDLGKQSHDSEVASFNKYRQEKIIRPPTPIYCTMEEDDNVNDAVRLLQKLLRGRAVQNTMFEGKERRAELIAELRSSENLKEESTPDDSANEALQKVTKAAVDKAQGEVVSELFDFLAKELVRVQEQAAMKEFVREAEYERRKREVIEGGRRHAEDLLRSREDAVYKAIVRVHEETSDDFILDIVHSVVNQDAAMTASLESNVAASSLTGIIGTLEDRENSDTIIVRDLLQSFLFPEVQRMRVQEQVSLEERKYVTAVHAAIKEAQEHMIELAKTPSWTSNSLPLSAD
ncbi:hypothetical protein THRCLA_03637 [Thraustotheca clavata]|uniref:Cilia- and flagella-associated protein 91 n=1 Tax=Thraustotheca clavata TaxID=74557 RepID=A0A1W0A1M5_9STRA|nr:hypothetical protein THRCLA_03637 [Thraustotheca clavata]